MKYKKETVVLRLEKKKRPIFDIVFSLVGKKGHQAYNSHNIIYLI